MVATGSQEVNEQVLFPNRVRKKDKKEDIWLFQVKRVNKHVLRRVCHHKRKGDPFKPPKMHRRWKKYSGFRIPNHRQ